MDLLQLSLHDEDRFCVTLTSLKYKDASNRFDVGGKRTEPFMNPGSSSVSYIERLYQLLSLCLFALFSYVLIFFFFPPSYTVKQMTQ